LLEGPIACAHMSAFTEAH